MNKHLFGTLAFLFFSTQSYSQQKTIDVDSLYIEATQSYKNKAYSEALQLTTAVIQQAPDYDDARVLQIRLSQNVLNFDSAAVDILYLLKNDKLELVKPLVLKQLTIYHQKNDFIKFKEVTSPYLRDNPDYILTSTEVFVGFKDKTAAKTVLERLKKTPLNAKQNYRAQTLNGILNNNQIGVSHQLISFLEDYPITKSWNNLSLEYSRFFGKNAVSARVVYNNRFNDDGNLYEVDAYPVFSENLYSYVSISTSNADFLHNFGTSASLFYSIKHIAEIEGGFRFLDFDSGSYFSTVVGVTKYVGAFYINGRAFIGPKKDGNYIQNYQLNTRYYLQTPGDYFYLRIGTGIAPDDNARFSQVVQNANLVAKYANVGVSKWISNYNLNFSVGYLQENLSNNRNGHQFNTSLGLKHRF